MSEQKLTTPKPVRQTRLDRAIERQMQRLAKTVTPYAVALTGAVAAAMLLHTRIPFWTVLGAVAWHGLLALHEGYGWHRRGGRAAVRARRRYQGFAVRRELRLYL